MQYIKELRNRTLDADVGVSLAAGYADEPVLHPDKNRYTTKVVLESF
ncbi:hypothetical protein [Scytonema sp. HK-05]|nr:hypothetical protein [Scytonema sp. HK-05]